MKIITVIGARPQFIKAAVVSRAMQQAGIQEFILHTGQHYDYTMSELFFLQLGIPAPKWHLNCGNDIMLMRETILPILRDERPDLVLVYGDTYSTLAGAQAAHELHIPIAHVEAGLRSFNDTMPEEHNRIETDRMSTWLFCPTRTAVENLHREGYQKGIYHVGDVMLDATRIYTPDEPTQRTILQQYGIASKRFALATIHRASTAENEAAIQSIWEALAQMPYEILLPLHPHTAKTVAASAVLQQTLAKVGNIQIIEPVGYIEMLALERHARLIFTDSGGIQKEAFFQGTPCITLREETEWTETVESGWNRLAGTDTQRIIQAASEPFAKQPILDFGDGKSAQQIIEILCQNRY